MNPFRSTSARFHKKLLTKTMAIGVILALMGTACLIQLANVQLVNGKSMAQAAAQSRTITVTLKASRGKIMDTNGSILAQSVERYTIIGNPEEAQAFTPTTCTKQTGDNCHQIDGKPRPWPGCSPRCWTWMPPNWVPCSRGQANSRC